MHRTVSGTRAYFETNFGFTVKNASSGSGSEIAIAPERRRGFGFSGARTRGSVSPRIGGGSPRAGKCFGESLARRFSSARSLARRSASSRSTRSISFSLTRSSSSLVRWVCLLCLPLFFRPFPIRLLLSKLLAQRLVLHNRCNHAISLIMRRLKRVAAAQVHCKPP
jgi:hypothetical protein